MNAMTVHGTTASLPLLLAGTSASAPQALAGQMAAAWTRQYPRASCPLACWTATDTALPLPPGLHTLFWLPTPASAAAAEKALEQHCRTRLMDYVQAGGTLRLLYGLPQHQQAALWECLQAWQAAARQALLPDHDALQQHSHAAGLRCRECLDPDSERKLFSGLLTAQPRPPAST